MNFEDVHSWKLWYFTANTFGIVSAFFCLYPYHCPGFSRHCYHNALMSHPRQYTMTIFLRAFILHWAVSMISCRQSISRSFLYKWSYGHSMNLSLTSRRMTTWDITILLYGHCWMINLARPVWLHYDFRHSQWTHADSKWSLQVPKSSGSHVTSCAHFLSVSTQRFHPEQNVTQGQFLVGYVCTQFLPHKNYKT